jgi:hypothetical protein
MGEFLVIVLGVITANVVLTLSWLVALSIPKVLGKFVRWSTWFGSRMMNSLEKED